MEIVIYHNPKCSKSRQTLQLLESKGLKPRIIEYLKEPPTVSELQEILKLLGLKARELMRKKEKEYTEHGLGDAGLKEGDLIGAMSLYPALIERPIVLANGKAALGRPPENVLSIL